MLVMIVQTLVTIGAYTATMEELTGLRLEVSTELNPRTRRHDVDEREHTRETPPAYMHLPVSSPRNFSAVGCRPKIAIPSYRAELPLSHTVCSTKGTTGQHIVSTRVFISR
jgi:hypothetical protein